MSSAALFEEQSPGDYGQKYGEGAPQGEIGDTAREGRTKIGAN
jgi:hypothetical protein